jgi:hypothetical protein
VFGEAPAGPRSIPLTALSVSVAQPIPESISLCSRRSFHTVSYSMPLTTRVGFGCKSRASTKNPSASPAVMIGSIRAKVAFVIGFFVAGKIPNSSNRRPTGESRSMILRNASGFSLGYYNSVRKEHQCVPR